LANIASAEKANRQRIRHRERNLYHLTTMRSAVKKVRTAITAKDAKAAQAALAPAVKVIDKTAQKGVIDKKTAARKISRLTLAVNALGAQ
jgi:small subunit ribosomal protein S20